MAFFISFCLSNPIESNWPILILLFFLMPSWFKSWVGYGQPETPFPGLFGWHRSRLLQEADGSDGLKASSGSNSTWLVVEPPLWKIWKSVGMKFPIYGEKECSKPWTRNLLLGGLRYDSIWGLRKIMRPIQVGKRSIQQTSRVPQRNFNPWKWHGQPLIVHKNVIFCWEAKLPVQGGGWWHLDYPGFLVCRR